MASSILVARSDDAIVLGGAAQALDLVQDGLGHPFLGGARDVRLAAVAAQDQ